MSTETQEIDNLPDNCGFEPSHSTGPSISRGGVDSETQATNPSTDLGQKPGPRIVRIEEVKRPSNKPFTKEVTTEAGMDTMLGGCKIGPKESWWQCYKLEVVADMLRIEEVPTKLFCSMPCVDKYKQENFIKCALESCFKRFLKIRGGILVGSNWYWSQKCAEEDNPDVDEAYEDEGDEEENQQEPIDEEAEGETGNLQE